MSSSISILFAASAAWLAVAIAFAVESKTATWRPVSLVFAIILTAASVPCIVHLLLS